MESFILGPTHKTGFSFNTVTSLGNGLRETNSAQ